MTHFLLEGRFTGEFSHMVFHVLALRICGFVGIQVVNVAFLINVDCEIHVRVEEDILRDVWLVAVRRDELEEAHFAGIRFKLQRVDVLIVIREGLIRKRQIFLGAVMLQLKSLAIADIHVLILVELYEILREFAH